VTVILTQASHGRFTTRGEFTMQTPAPLSGLQKELIRGEEVMVAGQAHYPFRRRFIVLAVMSCALPVLSIFMTLLPEEQRGTFLLSLYQIAGLLIVVFAFLGWADNSSSQEEQGVLQGLPKLMG
jgi:hypothetical protein